MSDKTPTAEAKPCKKCTLPELCNGGLSCAVESARQARAREAMYREAGYP